MPEENDDQLRTIQELARHFRVSDRCVLGWIRRKRLGSYKVGGQHRVHVEQHVRPWLKVPDGEPINIPKLPDRRRQPAMT